VVVGIGIVGAREDTSGVAIPVICDLVVIIDMYPGKVFGSVIPVRARVCATILLSVVFGGRARSARNVDVDEVAKEDHELRSQTFYCFGEEFETGIAQGVPEGHVWEVVLEARRVNKGEGSGVFDTFGDVSCSRWGGEVARVIVR
jgi:hypothetical protein